jgi:EAL domain-containing protein (putative c-di-GMP-specific phosphodiesterase class I)
MQRERIFLNIVRSIPAISKLRLRSLATQAICNAVAEGAESKEESEMLAEMEVDEIQGFYYGKPMNADKFLKWLVNFNTQ